MSGSRSWRQYSTDAGVNYSVNMDESNANGTQGSGGVLCAVPTANLPRLPMGVKKRYVIAYAINNPKIKRKFTVGSTARFAALQAAAGTAISAADYSASGNSTGGTLVLWQISYFRGEAARLPAAFNAVDTGLDDGSVSQ